MIDLKKLGVSQDIKELKRDKETRREKYYDKTSEKKKLSLMKEAYRIKYESDSPKEQKDIGTRLIKEGAKKLSQEAEIKRQESNIYSKSFLGRVEKGLTRLADKGYRKLGERVISRKVLKKSKLTVRIPEYKAPSILGDKNRFFNSEWEETKKSLFFQ